jgi:hypothetical protein
MTTPSLYAVEIDDRIVTVRAIVFLPSARESAEGEVPEVEFHAVGGVNAHDIEAPESDWEALEAAVLEAEAERRAAAREAIGG